jgi:hypothetical protein
MPEPAAVMASPAPAVVAAPPGTRPAAPELIGTSLARLVKLCGRDRKLAMLSAAAKELQDKLPEVRASRRRRAARPQHGRQHGIWQAPGVPACSGLPRVHHIKPGS